MHRLLELLQKYKDCRVELSIRYLQNPDKPELLCKITPEVGIGWNFAYTMDLEYSMVHKLDAARFGGSFLEVTVLNHIETALKKASQIN